jgi:hypothetical protein
VSRIAPLTGLALLAAAGVAFAAGPDPDPSPTAAAARHGSAGVPDARVAMSTTAQIPPEPLSRPPWERARARFVGAAGHTRLSPPRVPKGPMVDGRLDDDVWSMAAVLDSFTMNRPVEGQRDTLGTLCMVLYDDQNLYVAFRALDDPRALEAPVVPRDRIWQGDWVGVSIDSYNDQQRSFFLCANPIGIQMDGVDQEGRDSDMAPDFQFTSKGRVTDQGYEVEMAIPFRSLRFQPGPNVTFGFQAIRDIRRLGAHLYWAPVTRNINNYHSQIGRLEGLAGIRPGRNLQLNPTHTTTTLGARAAGGMAFDDPRGRFGLGAKLGITSNLIADVAMTPDFSQVEADAGVVDINERFAIFFEEKRPFFLEGSDLFTSPINLVYTRRIVDPQYGAKLTGKLGRTAIGVLNASDRSAGAGIEGLPNASNPYLDRDAVYTVARVKRDLFKNSYVGFLGGDRTFEDQYNRGAGVDGRLNWAGTYSFTFQGAHSWARQQDFRATLAGLTPEQRVEAPSDLFDATGRATQGNTYYAELSRDTRPLNTGVNVFGYSPDFAADMGFVRRTDVLGVSAWVRPHVWSKGRQWWNAFHFPMYFERDFTWNGETTTDEVISLVQEVDFPRNTWAGMEHVRRFVRHEGVDFKDLYRRAVWAGSERFRTLQGGGMFAWGDQVVFAEAVAGRDQRYELWSNFRFGPQLDGGLSLNGSTVWRASNDTRFARVLIPRMRVSYQFSKELSLRLITELRERHQWDAGGVLESRTQSLTPDVLLSYFVRPGTVVYLGYGSLLEGAETSDLKPQRSSVFTKVSYLWEM